MGVVLSLSALVGCSRPPQAADTSKPTATATGEIDRTVLPIAEPNYPLESKLDARDAKAPPRFEVKPPTRSGCSLARWRSSPRSRRTPTTRSAVW
jgi:arylsulfatase